MCSILGKHIDLPSRNDSNYCCRFCPRAERNSAELFCSCLTFKPHSPQECKLPGEKYKGSKSGKTQIFNPPMSEFNILATDLKAGDKETLAAVDGPTILLATKGSASMKAEGKTYELKEGTVFFVAKGVELLLESKDGLLMHTAFADGGS